MIKFQYHHPIGAGCALALCLLGPCASALGAETLQQAWEIAARVDHTLAAATERQSGAQLGVAAAQARRLPSVSLDAGYTRLASEPSARVVIAQLGINGLPFAQDAAYYAGIKLSAPLYTGGRISDGIEAAGAMADAADAAQQHSRHALKLAVAEAYIAVLRSLRMQAVAHSQVISIGKHADDVQSLFKQGYVARHDLLASQVALADAKQQALQAENGVALASAAYNRQLGRPQDQPVDLVDIDAQDAARGPGELAALIVAAKTGRSELAELGAQETALKKQAASVSAGQRPQLGLSAGWNKLQNKYLVEDKGWWIGVGVQWAVFDGGLLRRQAGQIDANARALADMREDASERIELQVRQSWLSLRQAGARIEVAGAALEQADETLKLARERYRNGLGPNSEVLDAEARRAGAYANRDGAVYDRALAQLHLDYATGRL